MDITTRLFHGKPMPSRLENLRSGNAAAERELTEMLNSTGAPAGLSVPGAGTKKQEAPLALVLARIAADYQLPLPDETLELAQQNSDPRILSRAVAQAADWRIREVELSPDLWGSSAAPLLVFHAQTGAPAVLYPQTSGMKIWRPGGTDAPQPLREREYADLDPTALCPYTRFPNGQSDWKAFARFCFAGFRQNLLICRIAGSLGAALAVVTPAATAYIARTIIPSADFDELYLTAAVLIIVSIAACGFRLLPPLATMPFRIRQLERMQAAVFDHVLRIPVRSFGRLDTGDMARRMFFATDIHKIIFDAIINNFLAAATHLGSLVMMCIYSIRLAGVAVLISIAYAAAMGVLIWLRRKPQSAAVAAQMRFNGLAVQFVHGVAKIRSSAAEPRVIRRVMDDLCAAAGHEFEANRYRALGALATTLMPLLMAMVFYALGGSVLRSTLTVPAFLAFMAAFANYSAGLVELCTGVADVAALFPKIQALLEIFAIEPENTRSGHNPGALDGSVEIADVTLRYAPELPPALNGVTITANPGEFIAIVGPSGAGKSTLVRLLLGFEQPDSGAVRYSGQDLSSLDLSTVRRQIGTVMQDCRIIPGSILRNITIGTDYTVDDAWAALHLAGLDEEVRAMPMGLYTRVTAETVSGGQMQRILIARALVGLPPVLILDESTSALDNATQELVRQRLDTLQMTRIVIAHRLSTIANADRIYVLDEGRIVQTGTFQTLIAHEGLFRRLAQRQLAPETELA